MKDFDDLLAGSDAAEDLFAKGFLFDSGDEIFSDLEVHVGLKQRQPDFPEGIVDIGFADLSVAAKILEYILKFF